MIKRYINLPIFFLVVSITFFAVTFLQSCRNTNEDNITELEPGLYKLESSEGRLAILKAMFDESYNKKYFGSPAINVANKLLQVKILEQIRYELRQYH